jgi:excisionase family DNA binding protein
VLLSIVNYDVATLKEVNKMQTVEEKYFTVEEIAGRLRASHMTIYRWIKAGKLGAYKLGGEFRITEQDIEHFFTAQRFRTEGSDDA